MKRIIRNRIFLVIISIVITASISIYGASIYYANNILYTTSDGKSMSVSEALDDLYSNGSCSPFKFVQVGDYISMTPTSTSYTTDTSKTGYSSSQILNPSELNLWRVIKINDDGTIEVVSEYASSIAIYFEGQTGYQNLVGYLNVIASQYENSEYTISSRIMGYNGQTEYITDASKFTITSIPWTSSTGSSTTESQGGGDYLYTTDTDLVQNALETLVAKKVGTTTAAAYWLGSRYYGYDFSYYFSFYGRLVGTTGNITYTRLWRSDSGSRSVSGSSAIRPILTLKSGLKAIGYGTKSNPFVLQ